jgi:hypothetical protein
MAVPTLLSLKVVAQHSRLGAPLTEFLSPEKTTLAPVVAVVAQITSQARVTTVVDSGRGMALDSAPKTTGAAH